MPIFDPRIFDPKIFDIGPKIVCAGESTQTAQQSNGAGLVADQVIGGFGTFSGSIGWSMPRFAPVTGEGGSTQPPQDSTGPGKITVLASAEVAAPQPKQRSAGRATITVRATGASAGSAQSSSGLAHSETFTDDELRAFMAMVREAEALV